MSNMSYCRFTNTLADLRECERDMESHLLSEEEAKSRTKLILLCRSIADNYTDEDTGECTLPES